MRWRSPRDKAFRLNYAKAYKLQPDVYAVQGYDAAQMLAIGLNAVKGDVTKKADFADRGRRRPRSTARAARSRWQGHNPVQDIYLRQVVGKENKVIGVASKAWLTQVVAAGCDIHVPRTGRAAARERP